MKKALLTLFLSLFIISPAVAEKPVLKIEAICASDDMSIHECVNTVSKSIKLLEKQLPVSFKIIATREVDMKLFGAHPGLALMMLNMIFHGGLMQDKADFGIVVLNDAPLENVKGVSYLGIVGRDSAVCLTRNVKKLTVNVIAHETAHALGADHDKSGLMTPSLSDKKHSRKLSDKSKNDIITHLKNVGIIK